MPADITQIKDRLHFAQWLTENGYLGDGVEVGVLFGEYSAHLLSNWPGNLLMVDPWVQQKATVYLDGCNSVDMDRAFATAVAVVAPFGSRAKVIRAFSVDVAPCLPDGALSFVYLDGNHSRESVTADIAGWWPKLRSGGVMCGHDFYERHDNWHDCGVKSAVVFFASSLNLPIHTTPCTSWWVLKP